MHHVLCIHHLSVGLLLASCCLCHVFVREGTKSLETHVRPEEHVTIMSKGDEAIND